jgi:hypothetical protein
MKNSISGACRSIVGLPVGWCVAAWVAATIAQLPTATLPDPAGVTCSARRELTDFIAAAHNVDSEEVYL